MSVTLPGEGGLGGQVPGTLRILAGHNLESRVPGQGGGTVVVFIALGDGERALAHQGHAIVSNLVEIDLPGLLPMRKSLARFTDSGNVVFFLARILC